MKDVFKLTESVEIAGKEITELQYRTSFKGKHLKKIGDLTEFSGAMASKLVQMACDMPPSQVDELNSKDVTALGMIIFDFLVD